MILSQMVLSPEIDCKKTELYYRGRVKQVTSAGLELLCGETVRFDTYFNAFFYGPYLRHTDVERVRLHLIMTGRIRFTLLLVDKANREEVLFQTEAFGDLVPVEFPEYELSKFPPEGALFLKAVACSDSSCIHSFQYETAADGEDIKVAAIICTYRRENYVYRSVRSIRENILENKDCPVSNDVDLLIVDNGGTICLSDSPHIFVFPNKNCGGSGGFARGMLEAYRRRNRYTHILLMDDDIVFETETLVRTIQFLKTATSSKRPLCIGGQMLMENVPTVQFESGASYIKGRLFPRGRGLDLSSRMALMENTRDTRVQYNAWWYCCLPLSAVSRYGLPLPLFIKIDDVEYGLRLNADVVCMNGIGVWHMPFSDKYAPYLEYYIKRNELVVSAIYDNKGGVISGIYKLFRAVGKAVLTGKLKMMDFIINAYEDFLKGPEFFLKTDGEKMHHQLLRENAAEVKRNASDILAVPLRVISLIIRFTRRYSTVQKAYRQCLPELTSMDFWCDYLGIDQMDLYGDCLHRDHVGKVQRESEELMS